MSAPRYGLSSAEISAVADIITKSNNETGAVRAIRTVIGHSVSPKAVLAALRLSDHSGRAHRGTVHSPRLRGRGPAARETRSAELTYRAAYIVNASRRLSDDMAAGQTLRESMQDERRYYNLHEQARRSRQHAAIRVDVAAAEHGTTLGWHAHRDDRTTPECRAADGVNFRAGQMPAIGYPGMPHGGTCRCSPGPPFATRKTVNEATSGIGHR